MEGVLYTDAEPIRNPNNVWEVVVPKNENFSGNVNDVLQTATYIFYIDVITELHDGDTLLYLTPKQ